MRFKHRPESEIPTIDLIPMLTVMMGVLAFFVVLTVSLGSEEQIEINLPPAASDTTPLNVTTPDDLFIVELNQQQQTLLNGVPIAEDALAVQIGRYLDSHPEDMVYLVPHQDLAYEAVIQFLGKMRTIGGDRVSLALEK
jgi:biopolymer transport protein ExbD